MVLKTVSTLGASGGGGGGTVTAVTATSPVISSGGTAPNVSFIAPGTSGNVLTSIGGVWTSNAAVGTAGGPILESYQTISSNYTITAGSNGFSVGPVSISTGVAVTVPTGQVWLIAA